MPPDDPVPETLKALFDRIDQRLKTPCASEDCKTRTAEIVADLELIELEIVRLAEAGHRLPRSWWVAQVVRVAFELARIMGDG